MPNRKRISLICFLTASWLIVALLPRLALLMPWRHDYEPLLPFLGSIPWDRATHVKSLVPAFFAALLASGVGALLVEVVKASLPRFAERSYLLLLGYQLVLIADTLRSYSPDWWVALTYWLAWRSEAPVPFPPFMATPWWSLVVMIAVALYLWFRLGRVQEHVGVSSQGLGRGNSERRPASLN